MISSCAPDLAHSIRYRRHVEPHVHMFAHGHERARARKETHTHALAHSHTHWQTCGARAARERDREASNSVERVRRPIGGVLCHLYVYVVIGVGVVGGDIGKHTRTQTHTLARTRRHMERVGYTYMHAV